MNNWTERWFWVGDQGDSWINVCEYILFGVGGMAGSKYGFNLNVVNIAEKQFFWEKDLSGEVRMRIVDID